MSPMGELLQDQSVNATKFFIEIHLPRNFIMEKLKASSEYLIPSQEIYAQIWEQAG